MKRRKKGLSNLKHRLKPSVDFQDRQDFIENEIEKTFRRHDHIYATKDKAEA